MYHCENNNYVIWAFVTRQEHSYYYMMIILYYMECEVY